MISSSKKIILFDAGPLTNGAKSGIGYYTFGLIETLARRFPNVHFVGHYYNFMFKKNEFDLPMADNISYVRTTIVPGKAINALRRLGIEIPIEALTFKKAAFIIYPSYISRPSLFKTPSTTMIHDLAYLDMPETLEKKNLADLIRFVPKSIKRSNFITTISQTTKKTLKSRYPDLKKEILVTPIPPVRIKQTDNFDTNLLSSMGIQKKYILFVGTVEPRKNIQRLIEAYSVLSKTLQKEYSLVIAGGKGWKDEAIQKALDHAMESGLDIVTPGYVTEEQRSILYKEASLFVFASLYEGFGMPLLEAMSFGTPVLASNIPVLKEVAGDAADYCDPKNVASIKNGISKILNSPDRQNTLSKKSLEKVSEYSWQKSTNQLCEKIQELTTTK